MLPYLFLLLAAVYNLAHDFSGKAKHKNLFWFFVVFTFFAFIARAHS